MTTSFDWTRLQSFLAIAEQGSLSAAARVRSSSQPTMGRHLGALEQELGVRLFERTAGGLELTRTGIELFAHACAMAEAANRLSLAAAGRAESVAGTIRITASEIMATYILPDILTALRRREPEIDIELVASDRTENLLQRDADIALRMYRPTQADVFTRQVGHLQIGMFAAHDYIERRGMPKTPADLRHHEIVGLDRGDLILQAFRTGGLEVERRFFSFRCDNQVVGWHMVVAGYGIGFNAVAVGRAEPRVAPIQLAAALPSLPIWLTAHAELKTSMRVRRVFDFLAHGLRQI